MIGVKLSKLSNIEIFERASSLQGPRPLAIMLEYYTRGMIY